MRLPRYLPWFRPEPPAQVVEAAPAPGLYGWSPGFLGAKEGYRSPALVALSDAVLLRDWARRHWARHAEVYGKTSPK